MRKHTLIGERIVAAAPALRPVAASCAAPTSAGTARGYPDGLAGEAIPLEARIVFGLRRLRRDDLRPPLRAAGARRATALAEMHRSAGTQFDPLVVDALERVLARGYEAAAPSSSLISGAS